MKNKKRFFLTLLLAAMIFSAIPQTFSHSFKHPVTTYGTTPATTEPGEFDDGNVN